LAFIAQKRTVRGSFVQFSVAASERLPKFPFQFLKVGELAMHMDELLFESAAYRGARHRIASTLRPIFLATVPICMALAPLQEPTPWSVV
jgi:hypothetical protein